MTKKPESTLATPPSCTKNGVHLYYLRRIDLKPGGNT